MNAAEITDKLGLHSLRQRAWVCCFKRDSLLSFADLASSTFNLLALHLVMDSMKVSSG